MAKISHKKLENQKKIAENKVGEIEKEQTILGKFGSQKKTKKKTKPKQKKKLGRKLANKFPQLPHFHREHWVHWMPEIRSSQGT